MEEQSPTEEAPAAPEQKQETEGQTAVIPKSALMGKSCSPGDTLKFKVVAVHDDEVQVVCDYGKASNPDYE
jgi:hypothetical protein